MVPYPCSLRCCTVLIATLLLQLKCYRSFNVARTTHLSQLFKVTQPTHQFQLSALNDGDKIPETTPTASSLEPGTDRDLNIDRIESGKCAMASAIGGSLFALPVNLAIGSYVDHFNASWEFHNDTMSIILLLFGLVYRYATRKDANIQIKFGVVTAFTLTRAISSIAVPSFCTSLPLECGEPFHFFTISMVLQGVQSGVESLSGFAGAAYFIEFLAARKIISL